jgi:hypothetical protein
MNEEMYNEIYDQAASLFRTYNNKVKGQQVSNMDNFDYWIMYVAYGKGFDKGFSEGYEDGLCDTPEELG